LIKEDTVKNTKSHKIKWRGHMNRMEDTKLVKKITDWNPIGIRTKGRSKTRWSDEAINDFKKVKLRNWIQLVKDEKPGMSWCRRAKPMYGCNGGGRRRGRRGGGEEGKEEKRKKRRRKEKKFLSEV